MENPDHSWRPPGKPHRMFLLTETETQLTRKDLYISREIVPTTRVPPPCFMRLSLVRWYRASRRIRTAISALRRRRTCRCTMEAYCLVYFTSPKQGAGLTTVQFYVITGMAANCKRRYHEEEFSSFPLGTIKL